MRRGQTVRHYLTGLGPSLGRGLGADWLQRMMRYATPAAIVRSPMLTRDEWPKRLGMLKMSPMNHRPCGWESRT